jgi:Putative type VII ESX secretion system translocon, EccE
VLADHASQERRVTAWGALLAQCGQEGTRIAGLQWLERTLPDSGRGLAEWWANAGRKDSRFARSYEALIADAGPTATRHETYLAVSIDARRIRRLVKQAGGGPEGAARVVLAELGWIRQALARADLQVRRVLSPSGLAQLARSQFDSAVFGTVTTFPQRSPRLPLVAAGPMAAEAEWSRYRTDGDLHAVYLIAEWPSVPVEAAWCYPLLALSGVRRTVSVCAVPIPPSKSMRDLRSQRVAKRADEAQRRRLGQIETAQDDDEVDSLQRRELELVRGHNEFRFTGWVSVSATTPEQLDAACALVEQAAVRSALVVRRIYGEVDQAFLAAAIPLNEGVR